MKSVSFFIFFSVACFGSFLDGYHIWQGERAYLAKEYQKALHHYDSIDLYNDEVVYNKANTLYRLGEFGKAITEYKKIKNQKLLPKVLHNLGNSYANVGNIKRAIESYQKALMIGSDKETKANLDLLTQQMEGKTKQPPKEDRAQEESGQNTKESKQEGEQLNQAIKDKKQQMEANGFQKQEIKNEKQTMGILKQKLSNEEEQKWSGVIERRGIRTILIPIETKEYK